MLCYRDMTFCANTQECRNPDCSRRFDPKEQAAAQRWWGGPGAPVAFAPYKDSCGKFQKVIDEKTMQAPSEASI